MPITFIPFDGWSPSGSYFGEGFSTTLNLFPSQSDWKPWPKFGGAFPALADGPMTGQHVHTWTSGLSGTTYQPDAVTLFTGSPTKLYGLSPVTGAFTNLSRGAAYTANPAGWRFASVGNDIWAANGLDPLQRRTNNAGNFADGAVSTFVPKPRFLAVIREHLVVGNLSNAGRFQDEIAWSDADDATNFDPPALTSTSLASSKRLPSIPGQITGLLGGQYGLAFKRKGIFYLEYTGTSQVLRPDVLSDQIGTGYPGSLIATRYGIFFLGPDGFYVISGLSAPQKISPPGVDRFLLADPDFSNYPYAPQNLITGTFLAWQEDLQARAFQVPGYPLVGWALRLFWPQSANSIALLYNPIRDKWSVVNLDDETAGTPERVATLLDLPYATSVNNTLAALRWNGTNTSFSPLSGAGFFAPNIGMNYRPANLDTSGELGQSTIKGILPVFSLTAGALTLSVRVESLLDPNNPAAATETRVTSDKNLAGWYPFRSAGRYFRITITGSQDQDFANFDGLLIDEELLR